MSILKTNSATSKIMKNKIHYRRPTVYMHGRQMLISRVVMAKALGRELGHEELVHHKDQNPFNNALSNLQLVSRSEHIKIHAEIGVETRLEKKWRLKPTVVKRLYTRNNLTCAQIAQRIGCSEKTISRALKTNPSFRYDLRTTRGSKNT